MSGIVGVIHRDGSAVPLPLLRRLTTFLQYRGPDGLSVWEGSGVGLGVARLHNSGPTGSEPTQSGTLVITADVRLDAPEDLRIKLQKAGEHVTSHDTDSTLILAAYAAWGAECVKHLRGDFAFGIWDSATATLFCARDHFGIKPFYYALLGNSFLFSNTLNCLRQHALVSTELNEIAIGDFLMFGLNYDSSTTTFQDIQRLPPAHSLSLSRDGLRVNCYWQPPTVERIRYTRDEEYVERFRELFTSAVADRLASDRVGILLSGGLDSGAVAAVAKEISDAHAHLPEVRSYTVGYTHLIRDDEGRHAQTLAQHLGISNQFLQLDDLDAVEEWDRVAHRFPEPVVLGPGWARQFRFIATDCRVVLSGEGPDNLMYFQMWPYIQDLARRGEWYRLIRETIWFAWIRPFPWRGLASRAKDVVAKSSGQFELPRWIASDFAKRTHMSTRWSEFRGLTMPAEHHLARPKGHASMLLPQWTSMFEMLDPGVTHSHVEVRYPYLDLGVVNFLLATPVFPWSYKKTTAQNDGRQNSR